jgi:hypothetical protein
VEMAPREGLPYIVYSSFFEGTFRLFRMAIQHPEPQPAPVAGAPPVPEAEPFEPPLHLTADQGKITPYRLKWDIESPGIGVGVTDDGTFLSNVAVQFSDLLGDHRVQVLFNSVSTYSNIGATYLNMKRRTTWGATLYDHRDFFLRIDVAGGTQQDQTLRQTGATFFAQRPFNRYYRLEGAVGYLDRSQSYFNGTYDINGFPLFTDVKDSFVTFRTAIVGDTTRYQAFGPFQGKRFDVGVLYGLNLSGDGGGIIPDEQVQGDILEYQIDFRAYKQATRRSLLAWRFATVYNAGEQETYYGFGGINQLRGFPFRDFFGSRVAWSNLEFRFPLADQVLFPIGALVNVRGFLFTDIGAAWLKDDLWWDPELLAIRTNFVNGVATSAIPFKFWDDKNNRLQDGRGSYGFGFQFFFIGGLQFNWSWAKRFSYTQYVPVLGPGGLFIQDMVPVKANTDGTHMDFYIVYDF